VYEKVGFGHGPTGVEEAAHCVGQTVVVVLVEAGQHSGLKRRLKVPESYLRRHIILCNTPDIYLLYGEPLQNAINNL
jgi:hypothetical protein